MSKKQAPEVSARTALIISKELFESQLIKQISKGKELQSKQVTVQAELIIVGKEYQIWNDYNIELLKSSFNHSINEYRNTYEQRGIMIGVEGVFNGQKIINSYQRYIRLKQRMEAKSDYLESLLGRISLIHLAGELIPTGMITPPPSSNTVFIIHGHDTAMKKDVQLFLKKAELDGIVLHEQPDKGRTVIEKLIEESESAAYAIAILSPDDIQPDGTLRARQNVVLEIGYFIGKLGRDKVRLLKKGDTVIPSDLLGILYDNYDSNGTWQITLAKEMEGAGLPIDIKQVVKQF